MVLRFQSKFRRLAFNAEDNLLCVSMLSGATWHALRLRWKLTDVYQIWKVGARVMNQFCCLSVRGRPPAVQFA
jgi:hypothetical protein